MFSFGVFHRNMRRLELTVARTFLIVLASLTLVAGCAGTPEKTASLNSGDVNGPNRTICKDNVLMTGTLIPRGRVCLTAAQWEDVGKRSKEAVEHAPEKPNIGAADGAGLPAPGGSAGR